MYVFVCFRKELVDNGDLSVTEDLKFGGLVLKKHPKSPETFSHRLDDLDHTICCYDLCQYWWEMTSLSSYCKISVLLMCLVNHNMYRFLGRLGNCVIILEMLKFRKLNDKSISLIQFSGGFVQVFELNTILSNCCSIHYTSTKSKIIFICILMEFELKQNFVTSLFI